MGATEDTVASLAVADGLTFSRGARLPCLTNKGHLGSEAAAGLPADVRDHLRAIYAALGGDEALLARKRAGSDPRVDLLIADRGLAIEVDEIQHFTTDRLRTFDLYAPNALCSSTSTSTARWPRDGVSPLTATGRRRQRPTSRALAAAAPSAPTSTLFADLAASTFGLHVLRIPAPECDGTLAYSRLTAALAVLS